MIRIIETACVYGKVIEQINDLDLLIEYYTDISNNLYQQLLDLTPYQKFPIIQKCNGILQCSLDIGHHHNTSCSFLLDIQDCKTIILSRNHILRKSLKVSKYSFIINDSIGCIMSKLDP